MILITKEQFLEAHNKLSPPNLCATMAVLNRFKEEKMPLLKEDNWCLDKHRMSFILWLSNQPHIDDKKDKNKIDRSIYKNYPETH